jgi:hypothetical protein
LTFTVIDWLDKSTLTTTSAQAGVKAGDATKATNTATATQRPRNMTATPNNALADAWIGDFEIGVTLGEAPGRGVAGQR